MAEAKKPTPKPAPKMAADQVEAAVTARKETVETVVKAGAEVATKGVEKAVAMSQEQVAAAVKAGGEVFKSYEDVVSYNKGNVGAVVKANGILVKGVQDINTFLFALAQKNMEESVALTKKLFECKSVDDVVKLQGELVKTNYAKTLDESRKLSDMAVKLAEEATKPIAERVSVAVEKATKPLAA
ncbi:MAG: phasin family protein [Rhodospirillaceae bacterium]